MSGRGVVLVLLALAVISSWGTLRWIRARNAAIDRVGVAQARLTLAGDNSQNLSEFRSESNPTVIYSVTLKDAPLGQKLTLFCDWIDPQGHLVWHRRYDTLAITSTTWETQCKAEFGPTSAAGHWTVEMYLLKRKLSRKSFQVTRRDRP